jgi:hypothetical protein
MALPAAADRVDDDLTPDEHAERGTRLVGVLFEVLAELRERVDELERRLDEHEAVLGPRRSG